MQSPGGGKRSDTLTPSRPISKSAPRFRRLANGEREKGACQFFVLLEVAKGIKRTTPKRMLS